MKDKKSPTAEAAAGQTEKINTYTNIIADPRKNVKCLNCGNTFYRFEILFGRCPLCIDTGDFEEVNDV